MFIYMFILRWSSYLFLIEEAMLDQTLRDMNNLWKFYIQHLNRVFLKTEPKQVVDYLDVKFNLSKHTYEQYRKPNDRPLYINVDSNDPPHVQKHVPKNLNQRLSNLSATEETFNRIKPPYLNS